MTTDKNPEALRTTLSAAADCIRAANHQTQPLADVPGLEYPADAYDALGNLKLLAQYLPQLCGQLAEWLAGEDAAGNIASDMGADPGPEAVQAITAMMTAAARAADLARALADAQNATAHLKAASSPA